jgi:hypothetical protein
MTIRKIDLDQPVPQTSLPETASSIVVQWEYDGAKRATFLYTKQILEFGRESTSDVCLRIEPIEVNENREATLQISRQHFQLTVNSVSVQITDLGSRYGTSVNSTTLAPNTPVVLQGGETVVVADALRLSVRIDKENDIIQAVRLRRVDNMPGTEYICLIGQGVIDTGENSLLRLPTPPSRQGRSRVIDVGQDRIVGTPAMILAVDGKIHIKRTGNDSVTVDQTELTLNRSVPFPVNGIVQVGNSSFSITTQ